jgi:hypothetical protein
MDYAAGFLLSYVCFLQGGGDEFRENNMFDYYFQPIQIQNRHRYMDIHSLSSVMKNNELKYKVVF